jgi:hypothetical protein
MPCAEKMSNIVSTRLAERSNLLPEMIGRSLHGRGLASTDHLISESAVAAVLFVHTQPDPHKRGAGVYISHGRYLDGFLFQVGLVDAD